MDLEQPTQRTRILDRSKFLGSFGVLTLAACAGGTSQLVPSLKPQGLIQRCTGEICSGGGLPQDLSVLSNADVARLTAAEIAGLSGTQIASFTSEQLHYITNAQAFHGSQASALWKLVAAAGQVAPIGGCTPGIPATQCVVPPTYIPPKPGSNFWSWWGTAIGGVVGASVGSVFTGVGGFVVGAVGGVLGGWVGGAIFGPSDSFYCFYDTNNNSWMAADLGPTSNFQFWTENGSGQISLNSDGYYCQGSFDSSTNICTVTVVPN